MDRRVVTEYELAARRNGKRMALIARIWSQAANPEEAALALMDLDEHGYALMKDGRRLKVPIENGSKIEFVKYDEEPNA